MQHAYHVTVRESVTVTVLQTTPKAPASDIAVVYAPGAGSNLNDPFGAYLAEFLESHGIECWRFQFPYSEAGRRAPDPPALLEATWRAVIEAVREHPGPNPGASPALPRLSTRGRARRLIVSGRSMGGRIASMVAAKGAPVAGLALFAYPLFPPARREALEGPGRAASDRAAHFDTITVPTLFCSGTRDAFATPDQLRKAAARIPQATVYLLDGADHGFAALKSSGRTRKDVWQEACEALLAFLETIPTV